MFSGWENKNISCKVQHAHSLGLSFHGQMICRVYFLKKKTFEKSFETIINM